MLLFIIGGIMAPSRSSAPLFTIYFKAVIRRYWPMTPTSDTPAADGVPHGDVLPVVLRELFEALARRGGPFRVSSTSVCRWSERRLHGGAAVLPIWNDLHRADLQRHRRLPTIQVGLLHFNDEYVGRLRTLRGHQHHRVGTLAVYLSINQQVMKGLTAGSVKG
jgi:raffinose/stachyose/melibiose transport system permease protein